MTWWRRRGLSWRNDVLPLLPWFVAGVSTGLFTAWFERTGIGAQGADFDLSLVERGLLAGRVFWFYLGKLVWPFSEAVRLDPGSQEARRNLDQALRQAGRAP